MDDSLHAATALAAAIRDGMTAHADDVEILVHAGDRTSYGVENDEVVAALECASWSVAMRALRGGAVATAATTSHRPEDSIAALRSALAAAQPDALTDFAVSQGDGTDTRSLDSKLWALVDSPGEVRAMAVALRDGARAAKPEKSLVVEAEVSVGRGCRVLLTRNGTPVASASTGLSAFAMIDGNDWDSWSGTSMPSRETVTDLGRALVSSLPERELSCEGFLGGSTELTVVLHPRLLEGLLRALLLERVAADRVLAGLSSAKVGDVMAHPRFELTDDPSAAGSLKGLPCDDEGVAGGAKAVIREGRLQTLLCDRRSAALLGGRSTGNGYRIPLLAEDRAEAPVRVGFGHLDVAAGTTPRASLVRGKTVLVTDLLGLHSANKATGAFNNPIQGGLCLEDGVAVARVQAGAWSATGNLHTMLRELQGMSIERLATGTGCLPWVAARLRVA